MNNTKTMSPWTLKFGAACVALIASSCGEKIEPVVRAAEVAVTEERPSRFHLPEAALRNLRLHGVEAGPQVLVARRSYPGLVSYKSTAQATLVSQIEGVIEGVPGTLGQAVGAGNVLCSIKSRELAQLSSAHLESMLAAKLAQTRYETERSLWAKEFTSRESYEQAEHELAKANLELKTTAIELTSLGVDPVGLEMGSNTPAGTAVDLSLLECSAPLDGQIIAVHVSPGEAVSPGQALMEIADLSTVWVDTRVPADDLALLKLNDAVTVHWAAGGISAESNVTYLAPEVDPSNQTTLARIELDNASGNWRPGLFVSVEATVHSKVAPLVVPVGALIADPESPGAFLVFVELGEGQFEAKPIVILRSEGGLVAVEGGLQVGERVVTGDTLFLKAVWMGEGGLEE